MPAGGIASSDDWWVSHNPITGKPGPGKPITIMPIKPGPKPLKPIPDRPITIMPIPPGPKPGKPPRDGFIPTPRVPPQPPATPAPYPKRDAGKY